MSALAVTPRLDASIQKPVPKTIEKVVFELKAASPKSIELHLDDGQVLSTPYRFEAEKNAPQILVRARAEGYLEREITVTFEQNYTKELSLDKKPTSPVISKQKNDLRRLCSNMMMNNSSHFAHVFRLLKDFGSSSFGRRRLHRWALVCLVCLLGLIPPSRAETLADIYTAAATAFKNKEYQKALMLFQKYRQIRPEAAIEVNIGRCYEKLGDYQNARLHCKIALSQRFVDQSTKKTAKNV